MGKAKLGLLLAGAYSLGLAILLVGALALPCEVQSRVRTAFSRMPEVGHRAARLVRVAAHAGSLGMRHLPALWEPQGAQPRNRTIRFCSREPSTGCGSRLSPGPSGLVGPLAPTIVRVVVLNDG
jgi:hypothetical protein